MTQILFQRADGKPAAPPLTLPPGRRRLSAIIKKHTQHRSRPTLAFVCRRKEKPLPLEHSHRLRETWSSTLVGPHDTVIVLYAPRGGGAGGGRGGGQNKGATIGLLVATVALAAIGQFWAIGAIAGALGTTAGVAGTIWAVGSTALLAGLGYFISKATKAKANTEQDNRPVYGVSGGGNLPRANDRIPAIFGRTWHNPDLAQPDFSIYDGDDQLLFKRLVIGCGKYALKSIRVAGVTMWTATGGLTPAFTGSDFQLIQPGGTSSLVPGAVDSVAAVGSNLLPKAAAFPNYAGPFAFSGSGRLQTRLQFDYTVQGSYGIIEGGKYDGKQYPANWGIVIEAAPCLPDGTPTGPFVAVHTAGAYGQFTRPQRYSVFVDLPLGRYTFRARNTGDPDTVEHSSGEFNFKVTNPIVWEGLRSHVPETIIREGVTELAMQIRSGAALSVTAFGEVEVEVQRILPVWYGGSTWIEEETSKAVWAATEILRDPRAGAGKSDSEIDLAAFEAKTGITFPNFSGVIRGPVSVYEALTTVLGVIRSSPIRLGHAWSMIRDEQKAVRKWVITRRQVLADTSNQVFTTDLRDGSADVVFEWFADGDPKRLQSRRKTFGTETDTPRRISLTGVTDEEHAVHMGTYAAATAYFRREKRAVSLEFSGRLILPSDKAMIDMWYFDRQVAVGIESRDGNTLRLTTDVNLHDPESLSIPELPYVVFRARDGLDWGPVQATIEGSRITLNEADVELAESVSGISIDDMLNTDTMADTSALIGDLTTLSESYLVRSVEFNGDNVQIEALVDHPGVWSALGEPIIVNPPPPSSGLENPALAIVSYIRAEAVQKNNALLMEWTIGRARNAPTYVVQISYDSWATYEEVSRGAVTSGSYPLREGSGVISVRAYGITPSGVRGPLVFTTFSYVPAVIDLGNAVNGSLAIEKFTDDIEPVLLVDGLPDPAGWVKPKNVFNIQDEKLYRITNDGWKPIFDISDIEGGAITETLIANDAITTPKIRANAVTADQLAANSVIAGKIQAGAVTANKINVTKLDAISADLGTILAGSININNRCIIAADGSITIMSASSGARMVILSSQILVYDASNVLRVRMGVW